VISINVKILYVLLVAALLSGALFTIKQYRSIGPVVVEFKLQLFTPPEKDSPEDSGIVQVASRELVLPAAGTYRVLTSGNCTLYVQTGEGLLKNPGSISVKNRGIRVVILNQTSDVVVRFVPQGRVNWAVPAVVLLIGGAAGYAFGVLKFE